MCVFVCVCVCYIQSLSSSFRQLKIDTHSLDQPSTHHNVYSHQYAAHASSSIVCMCAF